MDGKGVHLRDLTEFMLLLLPHHATVNVWSN